MIARVRSAVVVGVRGQPVDVEVHVAMGLPGFTVVGLPDASCREARDRVRAALLTSELPWPDRRVTVNLAPTHLRKVGSGLDLPIALAVLVAVGHVDPRSVEDLLVAGELGLDGSVRPVVGVLPVVDVAGRRTAVVPAANGPEARLARSDVRPVSTLVEVVGALRGDRPWPDPPDPPPAPPAAAAPDLAEVRGHTVARRALEVAAAGGHHLLLTGPPGAGKTMLAQRLPGLLPDLDPVAALEVSRIHSCAGLPATAAPARRPPLRSPHHTASLVALVGGGSARLRPGEVSLASGGVLFLDELGEFPPGHLDALRQPLEEGSVRIARSGVDVEMPARFLLVAATNPCPCGGVDCTCTPGQLARYRRRLSGPLLDRFDLQVEVAPPDPAGAFGAVPERPESSADVRRRVARARRRAARRGVPHNRSLRGAALEHWAPLTSSAADLLGRRLGEGVLTMRGAARVRAVALTLADLSGEEAPLGADLVSQATLLRSSLLPPGRA